MVEWHHKPDGHAFEQTLGNGEGKHGILQVMGSQKVGHNLAAEQQIGVSWCSETPIFHAFWVSSNC